MWNGEATLKMADNTTYDLCESDVTCSALMVSDASNAAALVEQATAALTNGGFDASEVRSPAYHLRTRTKYP